VAVKNFAAYSLTRLRVDHIDIYRPAGLAPKVPIEDTIGAISELIEAGYVRSTGLSEVGVDTIRRARAVHPICEIQIEYSLISRNPETEIFPVLEELGIGVTAYGVLSRGLLSGSAPSGPGDFRSYLPRFRGETRQESTSPRRTQGDRLRKGRKSLAAGDRMGAGQRRPHCPSGRRAQANPAFRILGAVELQLTADELARIEKAIPVSTVAGRRYDGHQMKMLDSEREKGC
jgi:hypothetical protein